MRIKAICFTTFLALASLVWGVASGAPSPAKADTPGASANLGQQDAATMRVEGEKRFRANCGRCHAAPHKFSPRMMATIVRHMRVRATITEEDMRLVLFYMSE
jgi:mono/diheme cytochrome c family protein